MTNDERNRAARLRRKLNKLGYTMKKTNCRRNSIDTSGGYAIIDTACNAIVRGSRFDLDLDDIDQFISEFKYSSERDASASLFLSVEDLFGSTPARLCNAFRIADGKLILNRSATSKRARFSRCGVAMLKVCKSPRRIKPPGVV